MEDAKKSFILYRDQGEQVELLSDAEAGKLFKALFALARGEKVARMEDGMTQMCYAFISAQIERDTQQYIAKCKRLSENARAKNNKSKQMQPNANACKQMPSNEGDTDTDTDTVTDTDTGTDTVSVIGNGNGIAEAPPPLYSPSPSMAPPATPSAPQENGTRELLDEEERWSLQSKGVPLAYIEERLSRAAEYAAKTDNVPYNVLLDWWMTDRTHVPWNTSHGRYQGTYRDSYRREQETPPHSKPVSFDVEDFFQAALAHAQL